MGEWNLGTCGPRRRNKWDVWGVLLSQENHREPLYLGQGGMELSWTKDRINSSSLHSPHMMKGKKRPPMMACHYHTNLRMVDHGLKFPLVVRCNEMVGIVVRGSLSRLSVIYFQF